MSTEQKRFEEWWDAKDDIPNNGPWTHDTPIQFAWAGWQAALAQPEQERPSFAEWTSAYVRDNLHKLKPEQEPVALETVYETIVHWDEGGGKRSRRELARRIVALFTAPPQRTWAGLTDKEAMQICVDCGCMSEDWLTLLDAIEAKLKEKNT